MFLEAILLAATHAPAQEPVMVDGVLAHPQRLLVKLSDAKARKALKSEAVRIIRDLPQIGWAVVEVPSGNLQLSRKELRKIQGIERVDLDRAKKPTFDPDDPFYPSQWHTAATKVNLAWNISTGLVDVPVAVIDTGVNGLHPDLAANMWTNTGEIAGNAIDDDGNGYVDDVNGYDFTYDDGDPDDVHGHGTACAGLVAATSNNGIGVAGVAPKGRIMAIKAALNSGYFYDSATVPAYVYSADMGAKVFSCSFFADGVVQAEKDAIDYAVSKGVLPVVAAANENSLIPQYPAAYENVIAVGAVAPSMIRNGFSNYGSWVDVASPGSSLRTTTSWGGYTTGFAGTSGACPQVAGLAALLFSANPASDAAQVRAAIEDTATPHIDATRGEWTNYGFIDAEAAMNAILSGPAPRRSTLVKYMTPYGAREGDAPGRQVTRIYGRGFQAPAVVEVRAKGRRFHLTAQTRDYIEFYNKPNVHDLALYVDGELVATFPQNKNRNYFYPMIEAGTYGATVTGGYFDTLFNDDKTMSVSQQGGGTVYIEGTFRLVQASGDLTLNYTRSYPGSAGGGETVWLYDWSSASFPYGNWVPVWSGSVSPTEVSNSIGIVDAARFVDPEGSVYFRVTTDSFASGTSLKVNELNLAH